MPYPELKQFDIGFLITGLGVEVNISEADSGDGYEPPAALIGNPDGLRSWTGKFGALPNTSEQAPLVDGKTRAKYLWDFFLASKAAGNQPFWIWDPIDDKYFLAKFVSNRLDYEVFSSQVYGAGIELKQRRVADQETPVEEIP